MMQSQDWLSRWQSGQIGFHQSSVDRILTTHWGALELPAGAEVLVPLCGKSLDVPWLRGQGHHVIGIDISPVALEGLLQEGGIGARRKTLSTHEEFSASRLRLLCGDFFQIGQMGVAGILAVYDRAAFGAMAPTYRAPYAHSIRVATIPGARILMTVLEYPDMETRGPPFSISQAEITHCYGEGFAVHEIARTDILASDARMRARGVSRLHEVSYLLTRLR